MKRMPIVLSLVALVLLAASIAYWVLQLYQPQQRPLAAAPLASMPDPSMEAAATLFGGQPSAAVVSNFQLTGTVAAGSDSVAILVADGAPPKALQLGKEVAPGVTVSEVHPRYVMLSDGGVMKRVDLATDTKPAAPLNAGAQGGAMPTPMPEPQTAPGAVQMAAPSEAAHPPSGPRDEPEPVEQPMAPGAVPPQAGAQPGAIQSGGAQPGAVQQGGAAAGAVQSGGAAAGAVQSGGATPGAVQSGGATPGAVQQGGATPGAVQPRGATPGITTPSPQTPPPPAPVQMPPPTRSPGSPVTQPSPSQ